MGLSTTSSASFRSFCSTICWEGFPSPQRRCCQVHQTKASPNGCPFHLNTTIILNFRLDLHENTKKNLVTASFESLGVSKEDIQIDVASGKLIVRRRRSSQRNTARVGTPYENDDLENSQGLFNYARELSSSNLFARCVCH